jgi:cysteine desulfurase
MPDLIYLDHAATTPLRAEAREAMDPFLGDRFGNPSSIYRLAQEARAALDTARDTLAASLGARPAEIIFTSGGTESNNTALKGVALAKLREQGSRPGHVATSAIEHHAVLHPVEDLVESFGFEATFVPVGREGIVDPADIEAALRPETVLVSIMWANNEIGTIQPIAEIARITSERGITFHVDAVQAAGALPIDLGSTPIDLLSISAHKFGGPKGAGALFVREGTPWWPLLTGGAQERNRRAGTENVAAIVGMAEALRLACAERSKTTERLRMLREYIFDGIAAMISGTVVNGDRQRRLPNNVNVSFEGVHGESVLVGLDLAGIAASSGSACTSGSLEPSHVLRAIGLPGELAQASLRLTLGRSSSQGELDHVLGVLEQLVARQRRFVPVVRTA